MLPGIVSVSEAAGRFDDDLRAETAPIDLGGIFDGEDLDLFGADADAVAIGFDVVLEVTEYGVVFEEMGQCLGIGQVIGGNEFYFGIVQTGADNIPPDTAEAVDSYFDWHLVLF